MKINLFSTSRMLLPLWGLLLASSSLDAQSNIPANASNAAPAIETAGQNDVVFVTGSVFDWNLNANTNSNTPVSYDQVNPNSQGNKKLTLAGTFNVVLNNGGSVDLSNAFWNTDRSWIVFTSGFSIQTPGIFAFGTVSADSLGQTLAANRPSSSFALVTNTVAGSATLNYTAAAFVPEPTSALAGLLLVGGLLRRRR